MSVPGKLTLHLEHWTRIAHTLVSLCSVCVLVAFNDIGKPAKDLLSKDYPVGGVKLEVKTTAPNGVVSWIGSGDIVHVFSVE